MIFKQAATTLKNSLRKLLKTKKLLHQEQLFVCGDDETRTRDLRRDRPAF